MREDNHPWFEKIKIDGGKDGSDSARYGSWGRWASLAYQMTGDSAYARKAFAQYKIATKNFAGTLGTGNALRAYLVDSAVLYDWIAPALPAADSAALRDFLMRSAEGALTNGVRTYDSDQMVGTYFGLMVLDQVLGTNYGTRTFKDPGAGTMKNVGGLTATAADDSTLRNAVRLYTERMGEGGQWVESSEYNPGTVGLLLTGAYSLQTATGIDHFPEVTAFRAAAVRHQIHSFTSDLNDTFQWGELQSPNAVKWMSQDDLLSYLSGLEDSAELRQFHEDAARTTDHTLGLNAFYPRFFYVANPYAPKAPWRDFAGLFLVTPGTGHVYARTGWKAEDRGFHIRFSTASKGTADHYPLDHGSFRLRRKGQWVINRPLAYSAEPRLGNQVIVMNSGSSREAADLIGSGFQEGAFAYGAGTTAGAGPDITRNYHQPPPNYLHENTRHALYLLDQADDLIVLFDRVHADDARALPRFERYSTSVRARMNRSLGVKQWVLHTPVPPSFGGDRKSYSWPVGDTRVTVRQVFPEEPMVHTVVDEKTDVLGGTIAPNQKKFAVHSVPAKAQLFDTFLHVVTAAEDNERVTTEFIQTGIVQGVRIQRTGKGDVTALFSAKPGPQLTINIVGNRYSSDPTKLDVVKNARLINSAFTIPLRGASTIYIADLDPSTGWTAAINRAPIPVSRYGNIVSLHVPRAGDVVVEPGGTPLPDQGTRKSQSPRAPLAPQGLKIQ